MAKKKKAAPPPSLHSIEPPTEAPAPTVAVDVDIDIGPDADGKSDGRPPSQHHLHEHEHHHHHSHYARSVHSDGGVVETKTDIVETQEIKEIPPKSKQAATVETDQEAAPPAISTAKAASNKAKSKAALPTTVAATSTKSKAAPALSAKQPSVTATIAKSPTAKVPSEKPVSAKPPSVKPPTVIAVQQAAPTPVPASPAPSHRSIRSHRSHHHPEVIVNVTIPQPTPAPVPAPVPAASPAPAKPVTVVQEAEQVIEREVVEIQPSTPLVVPASRPPSAVASPAPTGRSKLSSIFKPKPKSPPPEEEEPTPAEEEVVEETKVITTTTTTIKRRPPSPPKVISTDNPFVENDPEPSLPPAATTTAKSAKSKPKSLPPPSPVPSIKSVPATPVPATPMKLPSLFKPSPLGGSGSGGKKKPMKMVETTTVERYIVPADSDEEGGAAVEVDVEVDAAGADVDTAATTVGGPTTKGIGGARSNALTVTSGRQSGTKAGLRPIPMIDYQALIRHTPPPSIRKSIQSLPPAPTTYAAQTPTPPAPKTIVTMSAQLDRDSQGNEHLHARMRDHTGVPPQQGPPAPTTYVPPPTTVAPPPAPTMSAAPAPTAVPAPQTIVTLSAQLDRDSKGGEHLHARMRDHTGVTKGLDLDTGENPLQTEKERKKREKKEKKAAEKAAAAGGLGQGMDTSNPYRPIGNTAPPPKSERYAYPPAPTVIEQQAKERFHNRFNNQGGAGGMPGMGMGMGMGGAGMGMGPPYPPPLPQTYPRPPPLIGTRPPMFGPPMMGMGMNPMMGMGMGMGGMGGMGMMGMPMMGMGMPMGMSMPMAAPIPGVVPGQPGMGYMNSMPGRFGRDMLGRDFAGPGGVGSSQPYRPPDPSALPPMPTGLPFVARPGQEGFDQYGRMLPPDLPEGWDGWGRPLVAAGANAPAAPLAAAAAGAAPPTQIAPPMAMGGVMPGATTQTRDMQFPSTYASSQGQMVPASTTASSSIGSGRPDQPACFDRPPAKADSYYRYDGFEAFSFPAASLNRAHQLHLPPEIVSHDVNEDDWMKFIEDLSREALHGAQHALSRQVRGGQGMGPDPILSESVHSLLASWAVAFFAPRGIKVYAAQDGRKVLPPPVEPLPTKRGFSHAEEWSDAGSVEDEADEYRYAHSSWRNEAGFGFGDDSDAEEQERQARRMDMYLPRRERDFRKSERDRTRRRERRRRLRDAEIKKSERRGDWEIHFVCATPTVWQQGARPRTYGEPVVRLKR
ncbi:hypothetical protein IAU59_004942 [Kwoniella sp. CBS 9459]